MAGKLGKFQLRGFTGWADITRDNHLSAMWQRQPQRATDIMIQLLAYNHGTSLESFLNQFPTKEFDDDTDFYLSGKINHAVEKKDHGVVFSVEPKVSVITVSVMSADSESFERFFSISVEEKKIFNVRSDVRTNIGKFGVGNGLSNIDIAELYYIYNQIIDYLKSRGFEIEFPEFGM